MGCCSQAELVVVKKVLEWVVVAVAAAAAVE